METVTVQVKIPKIIHDLLAKTSDESSLNRSKLYTWLLVDASIHAKHLESYMKQTHVHPVAQFGILMLQEHVRNQVLKGYPNDTNKD